MGEGGVEFAFDIVEGVGVGYLAADIGATGQPLLDRKDEIRTDICRQN